MKFKKSLFIFRRDFRLEDNTGLIEALKSSNEVIPAFIFDPRQCNKDNNAYFSENAFNFLLESLKDLNDQLITKKSKLYLFEGVSEKVIEQILREEQIDAVFINKDYTPFSKQRDLNTYNVCKKNNVHFESFSDILLNDPNLVLKKDGTPYTVFTSFWKYASLINVKIPQKNTLNNYYNKKIKIEKKTGNEKKIKNKSLLKGGRSEAIKILKNISRLKNYESVKDYPYIDGTSKLSPHIKFGTVSIREIYWDIAEKLTTTHPLIRQLYWRDFFYYIAHYFPKVFERPFNDKYKNLKWDYNTKLFDAWKNGMTGFPIVDAGMRELNNTGYINNRIRMIVASFLTKDLHVDWKLGEKYFAQNLVDYDPCINNGNWQWIASIGCDAQPFFRTFNPWLQQKKFDPKCEYIKKWVPELKNIDFNTIHQIYNYKIKNYPRPIIDHHTEIKETINRYKNI